MALTVLIIIFSGAVCAAAKELANDFHYIYGCYESGEVRVDVIIDDNVVAYADFNKEEMVIVAPHLPQAVKDFQKRAYEIAKSSIAHCHSVFRKARKADPSAPTREDAPDIFIYSRYEGEDGVLNTLYCLANHFYPPSINFTWTKNGVEVKEGILNLRYRHNSDGMFHRISTLIFTPEEGDMYSCSVQHQALQQPLTRRWALKEKKNVVDPAAVFFGASLILCLMGIGIGVLFFTKEPN